jgi:hypothetical protein
LAFIGTTKASIPITLSTSKLLYNALGIHATQIGREQFAVSSILPSSDFKPLTRGRIRSLCGPLLLFELSPPSRFQKNNVGLFLKQENKAKQLMIELVDEVRLHQLESSKQLENLYGSALVDLPAFDVFVDVCDRVGVECNAVLYHHVVADIKNTYNEEFLPKFLETSPPNFLIKKLSLDGEKKGA